MKIGDRVEACGRCFEYYNISPGASGTIVGKPENYTGYVVEFDGICNKKNLRWNVLHYSILSETPNI